MIRQKLFRSLILSLAVLSLASIGVFAKNETSVTLTTPMTLDGTLIEEGKYRLTWVTQSSDVTVTLTRRGKVIATAEGELVDRDLKYNRSAVVYKTNPDGSRTLIEIRLGGKNQAIVFEH